MKQIPVETESKRFYSLRHDALSDRNKDNQHTINAITGLEEYIDSKVSTSEWGNIEGDINNQEDLQAALDSKVDKIPGKSLSQNDYTDEDKEKLNSISSSLEDIKKLSDYCYETWYHDIDYRFAYEYFKNNSVDESIGACSSARSGNFYGRNFDWTYDDTLTYVVHTDRVANRYATLGVSSVFGFDVSDDELKTLIPFFILDGINEHGVFCNTNVVTTDYGKTTESIPAVSKEIEISAKMVNRYILDRFESAQSAVEYMRDYMAITMPEYLHEKDYEVHWMVGDKNNTYIVEIIDGEVIILENEIMTNFYLNGVTFDSDGKVIINHDGSGVNSSGVSSHGCGLERYNIAVDSITDIESSDDMLSLIQSLKYTNAYDLNSENIWYTEFVGGDLDVTSVIEDYSDILSLASEAYQHRSRNPESPYFGTWQTVHSSIYDIENKKLKVFSQEDYETSYEFEIQGTVLPSTQNVWESGLGQNSVKTVGTDCIARGDCSVAEGEMSATGVTETIEDWREGKGAHAEGGNTTAAGNYSHTEGNSTVTNNPYEHAEGHFNYSHYEQPVYPHAGNTIHSVGIGSNISNRKNAWEIMQNGDAYLIGVGGFNGTNYSEASTVQEVISEMYRIILNN